MRHLALQSLRKATGWLSLDRPDGWSVRRLLAALAGALLAAALIRWPLVSLPSYEAGVACGVAAVLFGAWLAFERARARPMTVQVRWGVLRRTPGESVFEEARDALLAVGPVVLIPLIVLGTQAARTGCRIAPGVPPFLLVAAPAALGGVALGIALGTLTRSRRRAALGLLVVIVISTVATAWEGLAGPRHVVHDLFLGPISVAAYTGYDRGLSFPPSVYWHRVAGVIAFAALLAAAAWWRCRSDAPPTGPEAAPPAEAAGGSGDGGWASSRADDGTRAHFLLRHHRRGPRRLLVALAVLALPFALRPHACGFLSGRQPLETSLSGLLETPHFRIHHAPGATTDAELERIAVEHEWAWQQVTTWLDHRPAWKVDAWLHPDGRTLHRLTGARGYVFAAPWNHEYHATWGRRGLPQLRHELVHVLAADFGAWPFRASISTAMIEGLATALDEGYGRAEAAHESIAAAHQAGHVPTAEELTSLLGFAKGDMDRSYRSSASFVGWLLMEHGPEPLKAAYAWARFEAAYGADLEELGRGWHRFLEGMRPPASVAARARERFDPARHPAFYRSPCPRLGSSFSIPRPAARARMLSASDRHAEAADAWCDAYRATADPRHLERASRELLRTQAWGEALALAERALANPHLPDDRAQRLLRRRVLLLARLGPEDEAEDALVDALRACWRPRDAEFDARFAEDLLDFLDRPSPFRPPEAVGSVSAAVLPALLASGAPDAMLEQLRLDAEALSSEHAADYAEAALLDGLPSARRLGALLERDPDFVPVLHLLLARERAADAQAMDERVSRARRFASLSVETPILAASHLLSLARAADRTGNWEVSADLYGRALVVSGAQARQRLEARDGLDRARHAEAILAAVRRTGGDEEGFTGWTKVPIGG